MPLQIDSSTDSQQEVTEAIGNKQVDEPAEIAVSEESDEKPEVPATSEQEGKGDEESSKSDPSESEEEVEEGECADESDASEREGEAEKGPKRSKRVQSRIKKLVRQRSEAQREADHWRTRYLEQQKLATEESTENPEVSNDRPKADDYDSQEDHIEALINWAADKKLQAYEKKNEQNQASDAFQSKIEAHVDRVEDFRSSKEDFDEVIESVDDIPISQDVQRLIIESENGPELMYELAKQPDEYARICEMSGMAAARALGRFESKLTRSEPLKKEVRTTKAPPPPKPVGSGATGSGKKSIFDSDISQREYEKLRAQQRKERRASSW